MMLHRYLLSIFFFGIMCVLSNDVSAQKKKPLKPIQAEPELPKLLSYEILENGDTINKLYTGNVKQGKWIDEYAARYGEPGRFEFGTYSNGRRNGKWQTYTLQGVLESEEYFKMGLLDGEARYYEQGKLYCIGNYLALNAKQIYDTVMVEDAVTNEFRPVKVKSDIGSIRHGSWTFLNPQTGKMTRMVEYQADEVVYDKSMPNFTKADSVNIKTRMNKMPHQGSTSTPGIWMTDVRQKRIKYTDIPDDIPFVKPNERRKK